MLSREENELLCRIGPGTPMGALFRRYWLPIMHASELSADGDPCAFGCSAKTSSRCVTPRVGSASWNRSVRTASPRSTWVATRNQASGVSTHGWKFEVTGRCVDMPNEPPTSTFKDRVAVRSYLTRECGDVVWAYLGEPGKGPGLSDLPVGGCADCQPHQGEMDPGGELDAEPGRRYRYLSRFLPPPAL